MRQIRSILFQIRGKRRFGRRSGFIAITGALMLVVLVGFLGLAVDVGYLQWNRRRLQTAADAASLAAAQELAKGTDTAGIQAAARMDAQINGFTHGANNVNVAVNVPPTTGTLMANSTAAEVVMTQTVPLYFATALGIGSTILKSRAVSLTSGGGAASCVYVLHPTQNQALSLNGSANVTLGCTSYVNSNATQAAYFNGSLTWNGALNIVGNWAKTGTVTVTPAPTTGAAAVADPLAYVPAPTVGGCTQTNFKITGSVSRTLNPGVYCGGIKVTGSASLTFQPGTYILLGGGFDMAGSGTLTGTGGVTFYLTSNATYPYGPMNISGSSAMNLTAPTTGPLAGMLVFQDRTIASPAASTMTGSTNANFIGAIYFPTSALSYVGSSNGHYTILVAKTLSISGSSTIGANYTSLPGGSPVKSGTAVVGE